MNSGDGGVMYYTAGACQELAFLCPKVTSTVYTTSVPVGYIQIQRYTSLLFTTSPV
jgi:hypothetical protein